MNTIESETRAATTGALIHLRPELGALIVTGRDRQSWLNGLVTCDLNGKKPGAGVLGLAVGKTGKILAELWILLGQEQLFVIARADRLEMLREHFERHLIMEDAETADAPGRAVFAVHGPRASEVAVAARELGAEVVALDFTGRGDAVVILTAPGQREATHTALLTRAGSSGDAAGAEATAEGWEQLRIAWGVPQFGVDFDDQTLPQEASLERLAVSFTKGCYLGQETVFMLEKRGHAKKRLMRLAITGEAAVLPGAELTLPEGAAVGVVTSVAPLPQEGAVLALGYVKYKHAQAETALSVAGRPARALGLAAEPKAS